MHPRVSLNQVGFLSESTPAFIHYCREIGVAHATIANPLSFGPSMLDEVLAALAPGGVDIPCTVQPFARYPDLERDEGGAAEHMNRAIDAAAALGAGHVYMITGGRGSLDWEAAAARFAELIAPCRDHARSKGIGLLIETSNLFNIDITMAHTLEDTILLADMAGIGHCLDLGACWIESDLRGKFARAMPTLGLVQVCDYVPGDRTTPCKSVPGDGVVPLERIVGDLLELGYAGVFDIELVGQRIVEEGHRNAFRRAAENLSELLERLGA